MIVVRICGLMFGVLILLTLGGLGTVFLAELWLNRQFYNLLPSPPF